MRVARREVEEVACHGYRATATEVAGGGTDLAARMEFDALGKVIASDRNTLQGHQMSTDHAV